MRRMIRDTNMPWTNCLQHPANKMECAKLLNLQGSDICRGPMRNLFFLLITLTLASCALLEPDIDKSETMPDRSQALIDGFQALHQDQSEQALEHFETAIAASTSSEPAYARALLGKALVHVQEQPPWRDLDQAERHIRQVQRQLAAKNGQETISDWVLRTTASRLLEAERRIESANQRLGGLEQTEAELRQVREQAARVEQLERELAKARSEKEQAEETIARLRNLIMDE